MYIEELKEYEGHEVILNGWVYNKRESKGLVFLVLRDGTGICQCVVSLDDCGEEVFKEAASLGQESSVSLKGKVRKDERQVGGFELQVQHIEKIHQLVKDYPITPKEHGVDFLMDNRHLWLRSRRQT